MQHPFQFRHFSSNVNPHKFLFFGRTVPVWNALPRAVVNAESVAAFYAGISSSKLEMMCSDIFVSCMCARVVCSLFSYVVVLVLYFPPSLSNVSPKNPCADSPLPD